MNDILRPEATATPDAETLSFVAAAEDAGTRLDAFLAAKLSHISRTRLKQWIADGEVLLDGRAAEKGSAKLRGGETIELEPPAPPLNNLVPEDLPLDIVFEDEWVVVVNKPAGMVIHPAAGVRTGTLANALAFHFQQLAGRAGTMRPGLVHRLDRDTTGLVVVAKTEQAHEHLMDQFRERKVFKSYTALVHGVVREDKGRIEEPIARDPRHRTRMAVVRGGRHALSLYRVRQRFPRFTLLDVEIKTGRTHQIRVHLTWLKHPVVGDEVYGMGRDQTIPDPRVRAAVAALGRQFLHATRLGFFHPQSGEWLKFESLLPEPLARLLDALEPAG